MSSNGEIVGEAGLQFFGKMSASFSHEIKNSLAIIHESAGLLGDYTIMAEKGMPLDPERLRSLSAKIRDQILKADGMVKNMNRLAHSVDESMRCIDMGEIVEFVAELSRKFAFIRGVTLIPHHSPGPVMITTNPFLLENLLWLCLEVAMDAAGNGKTVTLMGEETEKGARICLTGLEGFKETPLNGFPAEREKALLSELKAELTIDVDAGELIVTLNRSIVSD